MKKIFFTLLILQLISRIAFTQTLDPTFGSGGVASLASLGFYVDERNADKALQTDGKILLAGSKNNDFAIARLNTDGSLDASFGTGGIVTVDLAGKNDIGEGIAVQPDGKIVMVGFQYDSYITNCHTVYYTCCYTFSGCHTCSYNTCDYYYGYDYGIIRLNPDGSLDNTFGNAGKTIISHIGYTINGAGAQEILKAVAIQGDGKIVATGDENNQLILFRFNTDGSLDNSFNNGYQLYNVPNANSNSLIIKSDGKILINAYSYVYQINDNSSVDATFGSNGILAIPGSTTIEDMKINSLGEILVAGYRTLPQSRMWVVQQYTASGTLDNSFGSAGETIIDFNNAFNNYQEELAYSLAIDLLNNIYVGGEVYYQNTTAQDLAVAKLNSNGILDAGFGDGGKFHDGRSSADYYGPILLQPDNNILSISNSQNSIIRISPVETSVSCPGNKVVPTSTTTCDAVVNDIDPIISPQGSTATVNYKLEMGGNSIGTGTGTVSGKTFSKGVTTVTYSLADDATKTCSFTITVEDNVKPTVVTHNITVQLDASGSASITPAQIDNGSSDNCTAAADLTFGLDKTSFDCSNIGDNTVTLTVTDANGNSQTGTATVTVKDEVKPTVVTQDITVQLDASGSASITPAQIDNGSSDNCTAAADLQLSLDKTSFDCSNIGTNTVTLTVTDAKGNSETGTATVTVQDNIKPTVHTQNITVQLDANGSASITAAQINDGSTDNCSIPSDGYSLSKTTFDCSNVGANTVTLTVRDVNGNSETGTATVTVQDNIKPTVHTQNITVQLDANGSASITAAQINDGSTDNCTAAGDLQLSLDKTSFDCSNVGANTVTLTVTDANGNSQTGTATVTVKDEVKPTVVTQDITVQLDASGSASITPAQIDNGSSDNCTAAADLQLSLDKTSFDCSNIGTNTVTLTVTDANGNSETGTATVTVQDNIKPTVHTQNITVQLDANGSASITAAQINDGSTDNCSIPSDGYSLSKTTFDCSNVGANTVTLTVRDVNGNSETGTATVTVQDNIKPTVHTQNITVQLDANGSASITAAQINDGSTDNCTAAADLQLALDKTTFDCSNVGANTVTLTVTDANGNSETGTATVTVQDNIKPTVHTQDITVQLDASGSASITPAQIDNGSSDNCTAAAELTLSLDKTIFDCSNVGENTVTLTVTDANGNSQTGTATVTVKDEVKPTVVTQDITVQLDASGSASITPAQINNGSSDNCTAAADLQLSLDKTSFDCSNVGANTVSLTVTDANGNSATGTATVTVHDNIKPTVHTQNITVQLDANGAASITATQINDGSTDNCSIPSDGYSLSKTTFDCSNVGVNTVTLTVTDANGNSETGTATVTVEDNINPVASCKSIDVYLGMDGSVTITPQDIDNGSSDNCSVSLSIDKSSFNTANVGANNVILTATDPSGNHSSCTAVVTVKQRPTTLTYTGDGSEQYSDQQLLTAVLTDQLTGTVLSGKQINFTIGSQSASGNTDNSGVASTNLILTQDPAPSYTVASSFAGDDIYLPASDNDPFDILQEDARAYYTGALFASTSGTTSSSAGVTLSATIQDITAATGDPAYDPYGGDIRNATVSFIDRDNGNAVIATVPVGLVNSGDLLTGTATYNWATDIGSADSKQFTIGIRVNNYYTRNSSDDNTVITVSKPLNNFITGGGYIILQSPAGLEAGKAGTKNNFGFNVKYNKSGKNLQGNINTIYRRMENDGLLHVYQIKGNAMTSLGIDGSKTAQHPYPTATFNGKANIQDITDPDNTISLGGNLTLQVTMTDRGEPGSNDDIGITVWNNNGGLLYSSNWNGITTVNQLLAGGNLKVTSGSKTFSRYLGAAEVSGKPDVNKLTVLVHPNPAPNTFNIITRSNSDRTLMVIFTDDVGRILETRQGVPANGSFEIGGKYRPGIYFMKVIQGSESVSLKLIKLPD